MNQVDSPNAAAIDFCSLSSTLAPKRTSQMIRYALQSERLGPLPLVNHFIQRMGLEDALHRYLPTDPRSAVSHARALGVLLRSIVVEREPIYRQQETVHGFASGMFGISAEEMEHATGSGARSTDCSMRIEVHCSPRWW